VTVVPSTRNPSARSCRGGRAVRNGFVEKRAGSGSWSPR